MEKLKFNPDNAKYYSEEFIKGFECGVERQFNADMAEKTAEWIDGKCNKCVTHAPFWSMSSTYYCSKYCPECGARMKEVE